MLLSSKERFWGCSLCCTFPTSSVTIHPSLPKGHNQITCAFCLPVIFLILWFREQCSNSRAHENYQKGLAKTQLVCSSFWSRRSWWHPRVCLADDSPDAADAAGPGDQALRISGSDFLPANHHTAVTSQLKSFYGFLLSTGQSPDFLARHSSLLCSDLELFFSRSTRQDSADSSALYCRDADLFARCQQVLRLLWRARRGW